MGDGVGEQSIDKGHSHLLQPPSEAESVGEPHVERLETSWVLAWTEAAAEGAHLVVKRAEAREAQLVQADS